MEKKHPSNNLFHKSIIKQDKWSKQNEGKKIPFQKIAEEHSMNILFF